MFDWSGQQLAFFSYISFFFSFSMTRQNFKSIFPSMIVMFQVNSVEKKRGCAL